MSDRVLQLEALLPEELKVQLEVMPKANKLENKFVVLSVSGSQAIVRNFELPVLSAKEIKNALRIEVLDVLSLHTEEIEVDYQILSSVDGKCKGVFLAMPKSLLNDYYAQISKAGFIPLVLTAKILSTINAALIQIPSSIKAFYILDFIGEKGAFLALFNQGQCELLRDISYDNILEAKQEISNSLRYAIGKSTVKHPEELYFCGETTGRNELIAGLKSEFNFTVKPVNLSASGFNDVGEYFKLNLFKDHTVSLNSRRKLYRLVNFALIAVILVFIVLLNGNLKLNAQIKALKKDFDPAKKEVEYVNKIKDLKVKIKSLENEK